MFRRSVRLIALILMLTGLPVGSFSLAFQKTTNTTDYASMFDRLDEQLNNGHGYIGDSNRAGSLAWGEGYVLDAYVQMYRATGDRGYLSKMIDQFNKVLAMRDNKRGIADAYYGRPVAGWGSDEFTPGKWHVWAVHTGMILLGPSEFLKIIQNNWHLNRIYRKEYHDYIKDIEQAIAVFEPDWHNGPAADEGYYSDPAIGPLPLDQQDCLGTVIANMYLVTRNHFYKERAAKLANYFKNRMRREPDGTYDWPYWPKPNGAGDGSSDIAHAGADVNFAVHCAEAHVVFNAADMRAFAKTWLKKIYRGDHQWADTVGGGGAGNTFVRQAAGCWLSLYPYDHALFNNIAKVYSQMDSDQVDGASLLGIAEMARWQHAMNKKRGWWIF